MTTRQGPDRPPLTVADLSEGELLARFTPLLPRGRRTLVPNGDDAAVVAAPDGRFVVSTDVLVENHHFRRGWGTARDLGARAAAQNLADIAAMGAVPSSMVVALVLPATTTVEWVLDLARGLADACGPIGVGVDGGDLSAGEQVVVAVTVHGDLEGRDPVLRSGARPGDVLAHAGVLGHGAAGYAVLAARDREDGSPVPAARAGGGSDDRPAGGGDLRDDITSVVVGAFLRPDPPLSAGPVAADGGATAMMDVSDGLLRDADRMARASGVVLVLDPLAQSAAEDLTMLTPLARSLGADPVVWALTGGEDHGMLASFPADAPLPPGFRRIGEVREPDEAGPRVSTNDADLPDEATGTAGGWDHFRRV
ncbi:thiamine-phosphate kinase [Georgenia sp. MJ173]|uniref:thiamine-phosphate kinase n=1 Tax=Georgenia sunbinii TaxID=3117728 RepID=UPI002F2642C7